MGIIISVVPKGSIQVLKIVPSRGKVIIDNLPEVKKWASSYFQSLPDKESDCKNYFLSVYDEIPNNTNYFFSVEKFYNREDDQLVKTYCKVLGPGSSVIDAYSTQLLFPTISSWEDGYLRKGGSFTKATKGADGAITFEQTDDSYDLTVISANTLAREKLKKMALQIPTGEGEIPDSLRHTMFWMGVTQKYSAQLQQNRALEVMKKLNEQYAEAELKFYKNLSIYKEYKEISAKQGRAYSLISLTLQAGSLAASSYQNTRMRSELNQHEQNVKVLSNQLNLINRQTSELYKRTNDLRIQQINHLRTNHIPIDDAPEIDTSWKE